MSLDKQLRGIVSDSITPEEIAELFAHLGSDDQARFFNEVGRIASDWPGGGWTFQLQSITDDNGLTDRGRYVMATIGEYSHWALLRRWDYEPNSP